MGLNKPSIGLFKIDEYFAFKSSPEKLMFENLEYGRHAHHKKIANNR